MCLSILSFALFFDMRPRLLFYLGTLSEGSMIWRGIYRVFSCFSKSCFSSRLFTFAASAVVITYLYIDWGCDPRSIIRLPLPYWTQLVVRVKLPVKFATGELCELSCLIISDFSWLICRSLSCIICAEVFYWSLSFSWKSATSFYKTVFFDYSSSILLLFSSNSWICFLSSCSESDASFSFYQPVRTLSFMLSTICLKFSFSSIRKEVITELWPFVPWLSVE